MSLNWPQDDSPPPRRRQRLPGMRFGPTTELFDPDPEKKRAGAVWLPTLIVIAILLAIGVALAVAGPLPTIFPQLDCGACEIHN